VSVEFTHEVAEGMHGAIVKGIRTSDQPSRELPIVEKPTSAGCG
jgi:hypothetical protein